MPATILQDEFRVLVEDQVRQRCLSQAQIGELEKMFYAGATIVLKAITDEPSDQGRLYEEIEQFADRLETEELVKNILIFRRARGG